MRDLADEAAGEEGNEDFPAPTLGFSVLCSGFNVSCMKQIAFLLETNQTMSSIHCLYFLCLSHHWSEVFYLKRVLGVVAICLYISHVLHCLQEGSYTYMPKGARQVTRRMSEEGPRAFALAVPSAGSCLCTTHSLHLDLCNGLLLREAFPDPPI